MPIYIYKCPNDHLSEHFQSLGASAPAVCPQCQEGPLERVLSHFNVRFRGPGFYTTDYKKPK